MNIKKKYRSNKNKKYRSNKNKKYRSKKTHFGGFITPPPLIHPHYQVTHPVENKNQPGSHFETAAADIKNQNDNTAIMNKKLSGQKTGGTRRRGKNKNKRTIQFRRTYY
jgi:hypothetical protein